MPVSTAAMRPGYSERVPKSDVILEEKVEDMTTEQIEQLLVQWQATLDETTRQVEAMQATLPKLELKNNAGNWVTIPSSEPAFIEIKAKQTAYEGLCADLRNILSGQYTLEDMISDYKDSHERREALDHLTDPIWMSMEIYRKHEDEAHAQLQSFLSAPQSDVK
jgi:hypothetical protein